jgi:hypothetical protein
MDNRIELMTTPEEVIEKGNVIASDNFYKMISCQESKSEYLKWKKAIRKGKFIKL